MRRWEYKKIALNEAPRILTREGRMAAIITAENRKGGTSDAERAELHKSLSAPPCFTCTVTFAVAVPPLVPGESHMT